MAKQSEQRIPLSAIKGWSPSDEQVERLAAEYWARENNATGMTDEKKLSYLTGIGEFELWIRFDAARQLAYVVAGMIAEDLDPEGGSS